MTEKELFSLICRQSTNGKLKWLFQNVIFVISRLKPSFHVRDRSMVKVGGEERRKGKKEEEKEMFSFSDQSCPSFFFFFSSWTALPMRHVYLHMYALPPRHE